MHILCPHLNSGVFLVACPLFFYKPLILLTAFILYTPPVIIIMSPAEGLHFSALILLIL